MSRTHIAILCCAAVTASIAAMGAAPAPATPPVAGEAAAAPAVPVAPPADAPGAGRGRGAGRGQCGGRGRGGGAGGGAAGGAPAVVVAPLPDAVAVDIAPPLDKEQGNFKIAPKTTWRDVPPIQVKEETPRGKVTMFKISGEGSKLFPGNYMRNVWVYVPAGYKEGSELPFMVDHDGGATAVVQTQLIATMDNYIAEKKIPMMAGVFIAPASRSVEYDTVSGKYCEYIENEVLPEVEKNTGVKLTKDPDGRGTIGQSSGGIAALGMLWFHPELYHRMISYSGSFTSIQKNQTYPRGGWEYHQTIIPNADKKPLRMWLEVGSNDLNNQFGDWREANNTMANVLKAKGYEYQFLWADGAGHVEGGVERQTIPEAMEWVWKTYKAK